MGKLFPVVENEVDLYLNMFPLETADHNTLAIIGLIQVGPFKRFLYMFWGEVLYLGGGEAMTVLPCLLFGKKQDFWNF